MTTPNGVASGASGTPNASAPLTGPPRKKPAVSIFAANKKKPTQRRTGAPSKPLQPIQRAAPTTATESSSVSLGPHTDYPIFIRKKDLDMRYHVMKFTSKGEINPYDDSQFSRPLRLFRRAAGDRLEVANPSDAADAMNDSEREQMDARRAERQAEREENQKLIAPTGNEQIKAAKKKQKKFVAFDNDNFPERQKRQQLRYEEARPWHLEDFDRKNIWSGSYEGPLSNQHALFLVEEGGFRMVPVEKYYKFSQASKFNKIDADEAAKLMDQKFNMPRFAMHTKLGMQMARREAMQMKKEEAAIRTKYERDDDDDVKNFGDGEYQADKDALDIEWDDMNEFQDDDEGKLFEGNEDEDAKEIEDRIREEMRQAGLGGTGVKNEELDPEEEYRRQQIEEEEERKKTKRIRKQLGKKEKRNEYFSDTDDPYSEGSSIEISEDEEDKEKEKVKEEAPKSSQANGDKSGASSRGTNTPTGRLEKRDQSRPNKRPGSPDLSDMSGNESSRKKAKGLNGRPAKTQIRSSIAGSGSGDESDASRVSIRPKARVQASAAGTPNRSRATSPAAAAPELPFPSLEEVIAAIPPDGIPIRTIITMFKPRVKSKSSDFINLVKQAGQQDKTREGWLLPKTAKGS